MKNKQTNMFSQGVVSDMDNIHVNNMQWAFPTLNYRVMNKEGQGLILTTLPSNTSEGSPFPEGEEFNITAGYVALGAACHKGVLYIVSHNETTNESEIGTFPSYDTASNEWGRFYHPLTNYLTNPITQYFRTDKFGYSLDRLVDVLLKESYDTSVDIYLCDGEMPNRVINSGQREDGTANNRTYTSQDFYGLLNQIPGTNRSLKSAMNSISNGGTLGYGNYYFYFRYLTQDFARTAFVGSCGVCQVFDGDNINKNVQGGSSIGQSNKKIVMQLTNLDTTYTYIEVVQVRYMSDNSNVVFKEVSLIDNYYSISGADEIFIEINGNETLIPFTEAEVQDNKPIERICKSHTQLDNRYFGANWKSPEKNNKLLADAILEIVPVLDFTLINHGTRQTNANVINENVGTPPMQYKNYYLTHDKVGYFRGETYAVGARVVFTDGSKSNVFPITGVDFTGIYGNNTKGIVRMPHNHQEPFYHSSLARLRVMGLKFNMVYFKDFLNNLSSEHREWFAQNVKEVQFVRAERKPMLKYQGLAVNGGRLNHEHVLSDGLSESERKKYWYNNKLHDVGGPMPGPISSSTSPAGARNVLLPYEVWNEPFGNYHYGYAGGNLRNNPTVSGFHVMPLFMHFVPMMSVKHKNNDITHGINWAYYHSRVNPDARYYGVYSPDFIFELSNQDVSNCRYVKTIARTVRDGVLRWRDYRQDNNNNVVGKTLLFDMLNIPGTEFVNSDVIVDNVFPVGEGTEHTPMNPQQNMVNVVRDRATNQDQILGSVRYDGNGWNSNRDIFVRKYIGLKYNSVNPTDFYESEENLDLKIVNLYDQEVDNIDPETWYPVESLLYYDIGQSETLEYNEDFHYFDIADYIIRYYGDCFLQRTYIKIHTWSDSSFRNDTIELGSCYTDVGPDCDGPVWDNINPKSGNASSNFGYRSGIIVGVVTENKINTAMRFTTTDREYYPHVELMNWAYRPLNAQGVESFALNRGHCHVLGIEASSYWDSFAPSEINHRPTRIRYSAVHTPFSFIDGYRLFDINGYADYDLKNGHINSIRTIFSSLISVQDNSINEHVIGRQEITAPTNMGDVVLGRNDYLSPYARQLGAYGTQHQFSVKDTDIALYGVDMRASIIWRVKQVGDSYGRMILGAEPLSKQEFISSELIRITSMQNKGRTDKLNMPIDMPARFKGVVTGHDKMYDEVVFTFIDKKNIYTFDMDNVVGWEMDNNGIFQNVYPYALAIGGVYWQNQIIISGGVLYGVKQSFTANTDDPLLLEEYIQRIDTIEPEEFSNTAYYENQWVIICDLEMGPYERIRRIMSGICCPEQEDCIQNTCVLVYVGASTLGVDLIKNPNHKVIAVCSELSYEPEWRTLVFSELIQKFTGYFSYGSHIYSNIKDDFFSANLKNRMAFYLHNRNTSYLRFYNEQYPALLSIIVTGIVGEGSMAGITKAFDNMSIHTNRIDFSRIIFETENQTGIKNPFNSNGIEFWSDPEWLENKYYMPVQCQTEQSSNEYILESQLRGTWLKIMLEYEGTEQKFIKQIETEFTTSEA